MKLRILLAAVSVLALGTTKAATFTVTTTSDSGPGSLRQAILDANAAAGDDMITCKASGVITLVSALPTVIDNTTIAGPGTNLLTISGNNSAKVFTLNVGTTNKISGLTIANGKATNYANGAGIANAGKLTISNCTFLNHTNLYGWGGGIFNSGDLTVTDSIFSGNKVIGENGSDQGLDQSRGIAAGGGGAGIGGGLFSMSGTLVITGCSFTSNSAAGGNGGTVAAPLPTGFNFIGNGCGGGVSRGCGGSNGGFGSGGSGAVANSSTAGSRGGFGGGGGGAAGQPAPAGAGGFGGGSGGNYGGDYNAGGGGAGLGGAIFVDSGKVTIVNCSFAGNQAIGGSGGDGGTRWREPIVNAARAGANGSGIGPDFFTRAGTVLPMLTATTHGGGTVTVDPPDTPYLNNSLAKLATYPASGWTFLEWLGDASGTNQAVNVKVTQNRYVQAVFATHLTGSALISLNPQADFYPYGTVVKLTALPPTGTYFASWSGDVSGANNPMSITVTNPNQTVSYQLGTLSAGQFALTVLENGRGRVGINPVANRYNSGQTITLTAVPDAAQAFVGWSGDVSGTSNSVGVMMDRSKIVTANFTKRPSLRVGTRLEGLVEDGFRLTLTGEFGTPYTIFGSTNLASWAPVGAVTNTYGTVQLTDPSATNRSYRFYRAESQ